MVWGQEECLTVSYVHALIEIVSVLKNESYTELQFAPDQTLRFTEGIPEFGPSKTCIDHRLVCPIRGPWKHRRHITMLQLHQLKDMIIRYIYILYKYAEPSSLGAKWFCYRLVNSPSLRV